MKNFTSLAAIIILLFSGTTFSATPSDSLTGSWNGALFDKPVELALWQDRRDTGSWKQWTAYLYIPHYNCFLIGNIAYKEQQTSLSLSSFADNIPKNNCTKNVKSKKPRFKLSGTFDLQALPTKFVANFDYLFLDFNMLVDGRTTDVMKLKRGPGSEAMINFIQSYKHNYFLKPTISDYAEINSKIKINVENANTIEANENNLQVRKILIKSSNTSNNYQIELTKANESRPIRSPDGLYIVNADGISKIQTTSSERRDGSYSIGIRVYSHTHPEFFEEGMVSGFGRWHPDTQQFYLRNRLFFLTTTQCNEDNWTEDEWSSRFVPVTIKLANQQFGAWEATNDNIPRNRYPSPICDNLMVYPDTCQYYCKKWKESGTNNPYLVESIETAKILFNYLKK